MTANVFLGVYLALLWVKGIRWWRYAAAHHLVGATLELGGAADEPRA